MNDAHVVALIYSVHHGDHVDYSKASPAEYETADFRVRLTATEARVEMKTHFANHEDAIAKVAPFLRAWELETDLTKTVDELTFRYRTAEIIDRAPTPLPPGQKLVSVDFPINIETRATCSKHIIRASFPSPPSNIAVTPDVESMWHRLRLYRQNRALLSDTAYYCLTALEKSAGGRREDAAARFGIAMEVLRKVGELAATRGGAEGRKAGATIPFSAAERAWLEQALPLLIRRAFQAHDPLVASAKLTMADLPTLIRSANR
jgi:hypothetical protein